VNRQIWNQKLIQQIWKFIHTHIAETNFIEEFRLISTYFLLHIFQSFEQEKILTSICITELRYSFSL